MLRRSSAADTQNPRARIKRTIRTLLSSEQFSWAIERESQRVDRCSAGDLALLLFRVKPGARKLSTLRLARTILSRIRVTDDLGWFDSQHLGVLLPETPAAGAWELVKSIQESMARHGVQPLCTMYTHPSSDKEAAATTLAMRAEQTKTQQVKVAS